MPARAWRPAVVARLARTLGITDTIPAKDRTVLVPHTPAIQLAARLSASCTLTPRGWSGGLFWELLPTYVIGPNPRRFKLAGGFEAIHPTASGLQGWRLDVRVAPDFPSPISNESSAYRPSGQILASLLANALIQDGHCWAPVAVSVSDYPRLVGELRRLSSWDSAR